MFKTTGKKLQYIHIYTYTYSHTHIPLKPRGLSHPTYTLTGNKDSSQGTSELEEGQFIMTQSNISSNSLSKYLSISRHSLEKEEGQSCPFGYGVCNFDIQKPMT